MASKRLQRFVEADLQEKEAKDIKLQEEAYVKRLMARCLRRGLDVPNVTYYTSEKINIDETEVLEYIKDLCREVVVDSAADRILDEEGNLQYFLNQEKVDMFCKKVIDLEKMSEVANLLNMEVLPLPSTCYTIRDIQTIKINHPSRKKTK